MSLENPYALISDYTQVMLLSLLFQSRPQSILILGLGGGSLPKFLWKSLPRCHIDVVEQSSLVADVCYRYFALPESPRLQVKITDALDFISTTDRQYDLLFIDLFDSKGVPEWLGQPPFFTLCRNRLKNEKSVLAWNFSTGVSDVAMSQFLYQVAACFDRNVCILPTKNGRNYIILAFPKPVELPASWEMMQKIVKLEQKIRFPLSQVWNDLQKIISATSQEI